MFNCFNNMRSKLCSLIWLVTCVQLGITLEDPITLYSTEAFFLIINNGPFHETLNSQDKFEFIPSIEGFPDLPVWMYYRFPADSKYAYLYGTPPLPGNFSVEVIAINKRTYDTYRDSFKLLVLQRENLAHYELQFKLTNLNVENMFNSQRLADLISIYRDILWKESKDIYFSKIVSPRDLGERLPANPKEKEGVIIRIGSTHNFSRDLFDLEREVEPIKNRDPCPSRYKFTRFEHYFRSKQFFCDWCSFKIIKEPIVYQTIDNENNNTQQTETLPIIIPIWPDNLTASIPLAIINYDYRNYHDDLLYCIYIPVGICLIVTLLLLPMLFTKDITTPVELTEPELTKYRSIERATSQLRELAQNQEVPLKTKVTSKNMKVSPESSTLTIVNEPEVAKETHSYSTLPRIDHRKQSMMSARESIV